MIGTTDYISIKLTDETQFRSIFDKYYISLCMFANQYVENDALILSHIIDFDTMIDTNSKSRV